MILFNMLFGRYFCVSVEPGDSITVFIMRNEYLINIFVGPFYSSITKYRSTIIPPENVPFFVVAKISRHISMSTQNQTNITKIMRIMKL